MPSTLWNDIRYAARTLSRGPGFAIAAIATIALGVGINTGIFTVLNGILFRTVPVPEGNELVSISQAFDGVPDRVGRAFSTEEYRIYNDGAATLTGLLGHSDATRTTLGGESLKLIYGAIVTCNYFDVLRQPPALGRALTARDCEAGAAPVVVLAHELWTTSFDSDPNIVGRTIELNRQLFTVVGVAREDTYGAFGLYRSAYFAPLSTEPLLLPNEQSFDNDRRGWLLMIGRRHASLDQVRAELNVIAAQIDAQTPGRSTALTVERASPLGMLSFLRRMLLPLSAVVMGAFSLVLLIACANVANLLLARATARSREIAVRLSLGATRARVIRQLLTESVLISVAGGALGAVLGLWSFHALTSIVLPPLMPTGLPPLYVDSSPDIRVFVFVAALMLGTGVLFGLAPALRASNPDLHATIKQGSAGTGSRHGGRLQGTLVGAQVAMCMVLMISAGLLLRALGAAQSIEPGFEHENVVVASYDLMSAGRDDASAFAFQRRMLDEVAALPGVEGTASAALEPLALDDESTVIRLPGDDGSRFRSIPFNAVSADYFDLIGIPLTRGRTFAESELADPATSVIVTEATARNLWPEQDAIGQTLSLVAGPTQETPLTVIGIARDAQVTSIGQIPQYYLYLPASPRSAMFLRLLVKSRTDFVSTAEAIRSAAGALDPALALEVRPLEDNLAYWRKMTGTVTVLASALGLLAVVLAAVGIYGVVAYFVGRRTREIGIRMALGARGGNVVALILRRTMRPVVVGAAVGVLAAGLSSRILSGVLFGISPLDPIGIGGAALFVIVVALAASILPGRRAALAQPTAALREE